MKKTLRPLDGVLLFDKPLHLSSNVALQKVRRLFQAQKAGHTGTLDPLATGLLPVCFGEATKFSTSLLDADKTYLAQLRLGWTSTTGDAEGELGETGAPLPDAAKVQSVMREFLGDIEQLPPMHSAIKHRGRPLYEYIRKGETIDRASRGVTIHDLELLHFEGDELDFSVHCSKGTYVRTLAEDIGAMLGCGAYLRGLRRTAIAQFGIGHAYTWEQLEAMTPELRDACLLPVDSLLPGLPQLELDDEQARRIAQGQKLGIDNDLADGRIRLTHAGQFIGVATLEGRRVVPERMVSRIARISAHSGQG